jgi:hypothetical protein
MLNIFADAAHAPRFALRLDPKVFAFMPSGPEQPRWPSCRRSSASAPPSCAASACRRARSALFNWNTRFESRMTRKALKGSGIEVPEARHLRGTACGTTGNAISTPTCSSTTRSKATCAASW